MRKQTSILPIICLHLYSVPLSHKEKQRRHFIPMNHYPQAERDTHDSHAVNWKQPLGNTLGKIQQHKKAHETRNFSGKIGHKKGRAPTIKSETTHTRAIPPPRHRKAQKEAWPTSWKKLATPIIKNEIISINKPGWQDTN